MASDRISMPSGMGGLIRYFDEYKSKFTFSPSAVIILAIIVLVVEIILHVMGSSWIGL